MQIRVLNRTNETVIDASNSGDLASAMKRLFSEKHEEKNSNTSA